MTDQATGPVVRVINSTATVRVQQQLGTVRVGLTVAIVRVAALGTVTAIDGGSA